MKTIGKYLEQSTFVRKDPNGVASYSTYVVDEDISFLFRKEAYSSRIVCEIINHVTNSKERQMIGICYGKQSYLQKIEQYLLRNTGHSFRYRQIYQCINIDVILN